MTGNNFGRLSRLLAGLGLLLMVGCAGLNQAVSQHQALSSVDETVKKYNRALRWRETDQAADLVVDEKRYQFTRQAESLKEVRIADYRITSLKVDQSRLTAVATVELDYYLTDSARVRTITQQQDWQYREESGWRLLTPLPEFK